jgi:group I intron endonuclease
MASKSAMRVGYIYLLINTVNGKMYVGRCVSSIKARWRRHVLDAEQGSDVYLHRAIRKYGAANFFVRRLYRCTEALLDHCERYYIQRYATSAPRGYNLTKGGDGGGYGLRSKADRKLIGAKIRESNSWRDQVAEKAAFYNTPAGQACRRRISKQLTGRKLSAKECRNHSLGLRKRYSREEERTKTRLASLRHYASPGGLLTRQKQSEAGRRRAASGNYFSEATRKLLSAKAKAQHRRTGHCCA